MPAARHLKSVHNHKAARGNDFRVNIKGNRAFGAQSQFRHFIAAHKSLRARNRLKGGRVHHALDGIYVAFHFLRGQLELVGFGP